MASVFRTLLIVDNQSGRLLYGHSIFWTLSKLDYSVKKWKQFTLRNIAVYFKDIDDESPISAAIRRGVFDLSPDIDIQISFDFPDSENFFIEKSYEEKNFNPFINLCTFAEVRFSENSYEQQNPGDYARSNKDSLEEIKEKFHIDLLEAPHLIDSFTIFYPTRIEENFKGLKNEQTVGYKISLNDYFDLYKGAKVILQSFTGTQVHTCEFVLDSELHIVNCGFVPDKHITTIEFDGRVIYRSKFSLIKQFNVNVNLVEERKIIAGDKIIHQLRSTERHFNV